MVVEIKKGKVDALFLFVVVIHCFYPPFLFTAFMPSFFNSAIVAIPTDC